MDVGAGWTELDYCLRRDGLWRGRYYPVDACLDGIDLDHWIPPREVDFIVCLETLEHLHRPHRLVSAMQAAATRAVIVSTPNPDETDVLGMDADHKHPVHLADLVTWGFRVEFAEFYGRGSDSLFGVWKADA